MRVFYALEFSDEIKEDLNRIQLNIKNHSVKGNFTRKENFHLTMQFVGDTKVSDIEKLKETIDECAKNQRNFKLSLTNIGQFPRGNKSIIWAGIENNESLDMLYTNLMNSLKDKGFRTEDKPYVPHITMGREIVLYNDFKKFEQKFEFDKLVIPISKISLMESTRVEGILKYLPIYSKEFSHKA